MKKLSFLLLITLLVLTSCHKDILADIDSLKTDVDSLKTRVERLEQQCKEMNTNIQSLQTLVSALQQNAMVSSLAPITQGSDTLGYTITLTNGQSLTIHHGQDGTDGTAPVIGVRQDTDGLYYWTLNGEWLLDADSHQIPVTRTNGQNGLTPQLKIQDDIWYLSYDGTNWQPLGPATGEQGDPGDQGPDGANSDSMFQSVTATDTAVTFTLADGTTLTLPLADTNEVYYTLTYCANDGTTTATTDTIWSQKILTVKTCTFKRLGCKFLKWNTNADGTGHSITAGDKLQLFHNDTLYAQWHRLYSGAFSILESKQVVFALGNIQYQASTNTWRFAEHQYDYIGDANKNISTTYDGWIDLFGWGTGNNPTNTSSTNRFYATFTDWGTNVIDGYAANTWRTLTNAEWGYVFNTRTNAGGLYGFATVNGTKGLILLPDSWTTPNGITFNAGAVNYTNNVYSTTQWQQMELAGAVFLPAAGYRSGEYVYSVQEDGHYWSSTARNTNYGYYLIYICDSAPCLGFFNLYTGRSVRLVQEL